MHNIELARRRVSENQAPIKSVRCPLRTRWSSRSHRFPRPPCPRAPRRSVSVYRLSPIDLLRTDNSCGSVAIHAAPSEVSHQSLDGAGKRICERPRTATSADTALVTSPVRMASRLKARWMTRPLRKLLPGAVQVAAALG
jgi:hypothetical protein